MSPSNEADRNWGSHHSTEGSTNNRFAWFVFKVGMSMLDTPMSAPVSNPNSNKFRAEPFVNLTAESLEVTNGNGGSSSRRASQVFSAADGGEREMIQDDHDELIDDDEDEDRGDSVIPNSRVRTRIPNRDAGRLSVSSGPHMHTGFSISDIQRASIASTTSSTSSARRSSYDPNEPGVLEKIHTGQGKSKRKPISVQQWKHMTTFKIRPPTATEAAYSSATNTSVPTPVSIDPFQQYSPPLSATPDQKMEADAGFVFIPEGGSANAIPAAPPIPRAVPIVLPPTTLLQASSSASSSKPPRKRARREEPNDPNIQVFYHDDFAPVIADGGKRSQSVETFPTPPQTQPDPISPIVPESNAALKTPTPPIATTTPPHPSPPAGAAPPVIMSQTVLIPINQSTFLAIKYDPSEQVFTLPEMEPLERGGPPPKKWAPVYRQTKTIGGGVWGAPTWISEGESSVPVKPPAGFIPGAIPIGSGFGAVGSGSGNSLQGLSALSSLALAMSGAGSGLVGSATPVLGTTGGLAPAKRVKKVKSDASIGGSGASTTPLLSGGGRKKPTGTAVKRGKKTATGTATPVIMEPPLVAITRAVSDTEMPDA